MKWRSSKGWGEGARLKVRESETREVKVRDSEVRVRESVWKWEKRCDMYVRKSGKVNMMMKVSENEKDEVVKVGRRRERKSWWQWRLSEGKWKKREIESEGNREKRSESEEEGGKVRKSGKRKWKENESGQGEKGNKKGEDYYGRENEGREVIPSDNENESEGRWEKVMRKMMNKRQNEYESSY